MNSYFNASIPALRAQLITPTSTVIINNSHYNGIKVFTKKSVFEINKSIIQGQYILFDIESIINAIINDLSNLEVDFPNYISFKKHLDVIRNGLNKYFLFYSRINNIYGLKIINFNSASRSTKNLHHHELKLLELNIRINLIDNDFTSNNEIIIKLFNLKNELTLLKVDQDFVDIRIALITKIEFLSYKWYLRTAQKEHNTQYINVLRTIKAQIPNSLFQNWIDKALNHYEISGQNWISYYDSEYYKIKSKLNNQLSFFEIHNKTKYLKDISKNLTELESLFNDIENHYNVNNHSSELDNKSTDLLINYLANNYYSLFCEKNYSSFESLKKRNSLDIINQTKIIIDNILDKYEELNKNSKSNINNFFLDYKATLYCSKILNELYETCLNKHKFIEVFYDQITLKINEIIDRYKSKKDWSLLNNNYIFKLDFNSSILNHNRLDVYYASSFTLAKVDHDIENKFREVEELYRNVKLRNSMKHEIESIYNLNIEFKKDNKRLIEIVGAFTAIISFIVGSIGAFEFIKTFYQAILFISIFGIAISSFVFIIFASTRGIGIFKKNWYVIFPFTILLSIVGLLTYFNTDELKFPIKETERIEKKNQILIDSVQKINDTRFHNFEQKYKKINK